MALEIATALQGKTVTMHRASQVPLLVSAIVALAVGIACARSSFAGKAGFGADEELAAGVDGYLASFAASEGFNGSVAVKLHEKTILSKGYGLANREFDIAATAQTKYRIASLTKQFTAMAILILHEQGELQLGDPLGNYLHDVPGHWASITLHQLLTHTSGLIHPWALPGFEERMMIPATPDEIVALFRDEPLLFEPGTGFNYSGLGYFVLARVIESLSGRSYDEFLRAEIFEPLGMNDTGADTPGKLLKHRASGYVLKGGALWNAPTIFMPIVTGGGNLYSTVEDLSRWDSALTAKRLISPQSYDAMYRPELENYAYGWVVEDRKGQRTLRHSGDISGFAAYILRIPDEHLCVIVLSNVEQTPAGEIAFQLADIVLDGDW